MRFANLAARTQALVAASVLISALCVGAQAGEHEDVQLLLDRGQPAQALAKVQSALNARPADSRLLLLKGVVLAELGRRSEAITVFNQLAQQYPNQPEPFNNLAVVHARNGDFDKALDALNRSIRSNPSYAVAHENLGDLYAALASQAYSKSLQMESTQGAANPKLALINDLFSVRTAAPASDAVASVKAPAAGAPAPAPPVPLPASVPSTASARAPAAPAMVGPLQAPSTGASTAAGEAVAASVEASVRAWAAAWSAKDVPAYLAAYGSAFQTPPNMDRKTWEAERKKRIEDKSKIDIRLTELRIAVHGDEATARFRQAYSADSLKVTSSKTLVLKRTSGRWSIVRESTGS